MDIKTTKHLKENAMDDVCQSSYKLYHSTETAMVCLHNDILWALDQNKAVLLVCLDLNAAFIMIDHKMLINRLENWVGITGTGLSWYCSFLTNRKRSVAFVMIDHKILINRLEKRVGITGTSLSWYCSFLTNRKQSVVIQGVSSTMRDFLLFT